MLVAFIIILICCSELNYSVALSVNMGICPYRYGALMISNIVNIALLISCIRYLGWIFGIVTFLCSYFSLIHLALGWILLIPTMFYKNGYQVLKKAKIEVNLLTPSLILSIGFCVLSFFVVPFEALLTYFVNSKISLMIIAVIFIMGFVARSIVAKVLMENEAKNNLGF